MFVRRSIPLAALIASVALGCATKQPGEPTPGLNNTGCSTFTDNLCPAFHWPIAVAPDPTGTSVYVASSNFDRTFTSGWISQFPAAAFDAVSDGSLITAKPSEATSVANMDSFAGHMLMRTVPGPMGPVASRLFIATRDHPTGTDCTVGNQCGALTTVPLDQSSGKIVCAPAGCSLDAVDLTKFKIGTETFQMTDPFAIAFAPGVIGADGTRVDTIAVTNQSPSPSGQSGVGLDAVVAFVQLPSDTATPVPPTAQAPFAPIASAVKIGKVGSNSLAVAPNGIVYAGGCFTRVPGETIVPCLADPSITQYRSNPLRLFFGGAFDQTSIDTVSLGAFFSGGLTKDIALSSDGTKIYVATAIPNALLVIDAPVPGTSSVPVLRATVPLANEPNQIRVLTRPDPNDATHQLDLVAVSVADPNVVLSNSSALMLVDPLTATIRAQVEPLGRTPFGMGSIRLPTTGVSDHTRLYVTLFGGCGVAAIDIPDAAPEAAKHVSTLGSCP